MEAAAQFLAVVQEFAADGGQRRALDGFTLTVPRGRICGLTGANGSGKSTALRTLAGLDEPKSGECRVFGQPSWRAAARRRLGFLPETPAFPPTLTAREFLEALARLSEERAVGGRRSVEAALEAAGAAGIADRRLGRLSQGQRARVGLAQALLDAPELLLLDEPSNGLDADGISRLGRILEAWRREGRTVLIAAHDAGQLEAWCDDVALVAKGRVVDVRRRPQDEGPVGRVRGLDGARLQRLAAWVGAEGGVLETTPAACGWLTWTSGRAGGDRAGEETCNG